MGAHFQMEIGRLKSDLQGMGRRVVRMLRESVDALLALDTEAATAVIDQDAGIDAVEVQIEENCLKLIALYQPVAGDLRMIACAMKVNDTLERVADHAVNVAGLTRDFREAGTVSLPPRLAELARAVCQVCEETIDAFLKLDGRHAVEICRGDDRIDELDEAVTREAVDIGRRNVEHALLLARVGHEFERVGDLMTNIAEDTIYLITGDIVRHRLATD